MTPEQLEQARKRIAAILDQARRETEAVLTALQETVGPGNGSLDMTASAEDTHRLAVSAGKGPQDAHTPVLKALGMTAGDVARAAGWREDLYSRCRAGKTTIPERHATAVQQATMGKHPDHPMGIEPTGAFWPKGVRVVKK